MNYRDMNFELCFPQLFPGLPVFQTAGGEVYWFECGRLRVLRGEAAGRLWDNLVRWHCGLPPGLVESRLFFPSAGFVRMENIEEKQA
jgi:hypothetical protein